MKFEHKTVNLKERQEKHRSLDFEYFLNQEGDKEWELVSVDNGIAYFKRPLRTKSEAEILAHFDYPRLDRSSEV
jgi:hypothetical protein